mmetsp:Transcript_118420/g.166464  ORF Transcript_118420/g.166464 Transcript_118420/m.166464 type:complete len:513 (-) Transcript_118420:663-2201(-)
MMRRRRLGKEQPHRVTLVAEGWLHTEEDVSEMLAVDQHVATVGVQLSRRRAPVLAQVMGEGAELLVFVHAHAVGDVQVRHGHCCFWVLQNGLLQALRVVRHILNGVALLLQLSHHCVDAAEDIKVRGSSNVALVRGELEDADAQLLLRVGLLAQVCPVHCSGRHRTDAVLHWDGAAAGAVAPREDQRLDGTVNLGQRDLKSNLHRVQAQLAVLPFRERLEHQGHADQVGSVELHEDLLRLLGILGCGPTHQGETSQVHQGIHHALTSGSGQILLHRHGEVQAPSVGARYPSTAALQFLHDAHVVAVILGGNVRLLQDKSDGWRIWENAGCRAVNVVVPLLVVTHAIEDLWGKRMPDAHVRQDHGLHKRFRVDVLHAGNVATCHSQEHGLQILRSPTKPVLQRQDKGPGIFRLISRQELQDLRQCPDQLQQAVLEVPTGGRLVLGQRLLPQVLHLLRKVAERATGNLCQVEGAKLVLLHHLRHRGEAEAGIKILAARLDNLHELLGQLLHKNQ